MTDRTCGDSIDETAIRAYRAKRIRHELRRQDREAVLVVDPINLRYATGTRNMQVWSNAQHRPVTPWSSLMAPTVLFDSCHRPASERRPGEQ